MKKIFLFVSAGSLLLLGSCKKSFLEVPPQGNAGLTVDKLSNKAGVQELLIGAYHDLTGIDTKSTWWGTSGTNWIYGDITSGDTYLGGASAVNSQPHDVTDAFNIENYQELATTGFIDDKWIADYDGVARANAVIIAANAATDMTAAEKTEAIAEARFLRGHFHFQAKETWNNVPYVDETVAGTQFSKLSNTTNIWPMIEADFQFAYANMAEVQPLAGQANKWAAAAYLAKCYMFEQKFTDAKALLATIIANGKNAQGVKYALTPNYHDNFDVGTENNSESILQINFSVNLGTDGAQNSNLGETGVTPKGGWGTFADVTYGYWKQPSFNLVNAFKTDANGLPLLDANGNDISNVTNMTNDMGIASSAAFTTYQGNVDPRLDWSVGRRGVPYLDWGVDPGQDWVAEQSFGGPYVNMKNMFTSADQTIGFSALGYYFIGNSAVNYNILRFADVLLWAAECEVEVGSLDQARAYVNMVRARAMNGAKPLVVNSGGVPSANYNIGLYNTPWTSQAYARNAVRMERRLEFSQEGQRFFDLVRWGIADTYLNAYLQTEKTRGVGSVASGATFIKGKNEYLPIPQQEIILDPQLKQNPGY